jgi:hypothetical protein
MGQSSTYTGLSTARVTQRDDFGDIVPALRHACYVVMLKDIRSDREAATIKKQA